jgi:site-specific DNA-methyltransferase (adenine-specific)
MIELHNADCLTHLKTLANNSVHHAIFDPPYFEIKGDFDFAYPSFAAYLEFMEQVAIEIKRILKPSGSVLIFGHAKRIAYIQVIYDKYFNLENSLVWHVIDRQTNKGINGYRCFAPVTERALYYSLEIEKTGLQEIHDNPDCFKSIKEYMRGERKKIMEAKGFKTFSEFNKYINAVTETSNVVERHYFADSQYVFPTAEMYAKLQTTGFFSRDEDLRREYEDLRREYEDLRRPFNNVHQLTDVIKHSQESHISKEFDHDTVKPLGLMEKLIATITRENEIIIDPFAGSGTTAVACKKLNRRCIAIEKHEPYFQIMTARVANTPAQKELQK